MGNLVAVDHLLAALKEQGFDTSQVKFVKALRKAQNPGGCEFCGAHTKIAVPVNPEEPEGPHKLSCCGKKAF